MRQLLPSFTPSPSVPPLHGQLTYCNSFSTLPSSSGLCLPLLLWVASHSLSSLVQVSVNCTACVLSRENFTFVRLTFINSGWWNPFLFTAADQRPCVHLAQMYLPASRSFLHTFFPQPCLIYPVHCTSLFVLPLWRYWSPLLKDNKAFSLKAFFLDQCGQTSLPSLLNLCCHCHLCL